jgi:hypothetical protein
MMSKRTLGCVLAGASLALVAASAANAAGVDAIQVTTSYQAGAPAGAAGFTGAPDTSFATFTNNGNFAFSGTISDVAVSPGGDFSQSFVVTLGVGQSFTFGTSPESSNQGGFGPNGIQLLINGTFTDGFSPGWSVFDADIHSGVVNGGGVTDAFVLQGGCPSGCDYGDAIEEAQVPGVFQFSHTSTATTPLPATWVMLASGLAGLRLVARRRKKNSAAA